LGEYQQHKLTNVGKFGGAGPQSRQRLPFDVRPQISPFGSAGYCAGIAKSQTPVKFDDHFEAMVDPR
jgi:hypothetical protein